MSSPAYAQDTQTALLFIPDISGFTSFVNTTEISHARHIIEELLEILIDANEMGLEVSEIEGDAILFYRFGQAPTAAELLAQVQRMYTRFHAHLRMYETHRICQCGACSNVNMLTLKFVAHFGEITTKKVKEHSKLFGKDVIVAHRLLKNDIQHHEYSLFTDQVVKACATWVELPTVAWSEVEHGNSQYDFGAAQYCYLPLHPLRAYVPEPKIEDFSLPGKKMKVMETEGAIQAPLEMVFNVISDLSFRHGWMDGLKGVGQLNSRIVRHGAAHRCIIKNNEKDPHVVSHDFKRQGNMITFTDTNRKDGVCVVYTLQQIGPRLTRVQASSFIKQNFIMKAIIKLFMEKKFRQSDLASFNKLNEYCQQLLREGREHPAQILLEPAGQNARE